MKRLVLIPPNSVDRLKRDQETDPGYQVVSVELKNGRRFHQVVVSEGCIIRVCGYDDIPFAPHGSSIRGTKSYQLEFQGIFGRSATDQHALRALPMLVKVPKDFRPKNPD